MIYFEQPPSQHENIVVRGRMGIAVYVYVGDVEREGTVNDVTVVSHARGPLATFDITSSGSAHVRLNGQYSVWPAGSFPGVGSTHLLEGLGQEDFDLPSPIVNAGYLPGLPVLPGNRRRLAMVLPRGMPPGPYILDINGDLSGRPIDLAVPFVVEGQDDSQTAGVN
jgi:hypothetical protein